MTAHEVCYNFDLNLGIALAKETPIYYVLQKTIEFLKGQPFLFMTRGY
jgi:hypothetical protein